MIGICNCKINGVKHFCKGYYVETIGNLTEKMIKNTSKSIQKNYARK